MAGGIAAAVAAGAAVAQHESTATTVSTGAAGGDAISRFGFRTGTAGTAGAEQAGASACAAGTAGGVDGDETRPDVVLGITACAACSAVTPYQATAATCATVGAHRGHDLVCTTTICTAVAAETAVAEQPGAATVSTSGGGPSPHEGLNRRVPGVGTVAAPAGVAEETGASAIARGQTGARYGAPAAAAVTEQQAGIATVADIPRAVGVVECGVAVAAADQQTRVRTRLGPVTDEETGQLDICVLYLRCGDRGEKRRRPRRCNHHHSSYGNGSDRDQRRHPKKVTTTLDSRLSHLIPPVFANK